MAWRGRRDGGARARPVWASLFTRPVNPFIGRLVALKTITPELVSDPRGILKRFYREAQSAGTLQHPNIVTIYDARRGGWPPLHRHVEFVVGESLQNIIESPRQNSSCRQELKLVQQFCEGLGTFINMVLFIAI